MVEFCHVTAGYGGEPILKDLCFSIPEGKITSLVGPNGCGKTTLLRAAARQLPSVKGEIFLRHRPLESYERKEFARTAAFLPQMRNVPSITVERLVSHGRFPYLGLSRKMRSQDRQAVQKAMESTGVSQWALRELTELSGGQRQRVYIAMVLAQDPDIIFLDEPTNNLDIYHASNMMKMVRKLSDELGKTVILVLHEINYAAFYSDYICAFKNGKIAKYGTVEEVIQKEVLSEIYQVDFEILNIKGKPLSVYY